MELNEIKKQGKWTDISDTLNENFAKINAETQRIELASRKNKGYYATYDELTSIVPQGDMGDIAFIGTNYPYRIYKWDGTAWIDTFEKGGAQNVNLANYYTREEVDRKVAKNTDGIELLNTNTGVSEYPTFDEAKAYAVGKVVLYEGLLKRFTSAHEAGAWDNSQVESWSEKKEVDGKVAELEQEITDLEYITKPGLLRFDVYFSENGWYDFATGKFHETTSQKSTQKIRAKEGEIFHVNISRVVDASVSVIYAMWNGDTYLQDKSLQVSDTGAAFVGDVIIPADVTHIAFSAFGLATNTEVYFERELREIDVSKIAEIKDLQSRVSQLEKEPATKTELREIKEEQETIKNAVANAENDIEALTLTTYDSQVIETEENGWYDFATGKFHETTSQKSTQKIKVEKGDTFDVKIDTIAYSPSVIYAMWNGDTYLQDKSLQASDSLQLYEATITIPSGVTHIAFSALGWGSNKFIQHNKISKVLNAEKMSDIVRYTTIVVKRKGTVGVDCDFTGLNGIHEALESIKDNSYYNRYIIKVTGHFIFNGDSVMQSEYWTAMNNENQMNTWFANVYGKDYVTIDGGNTDDTSIEVYLESDTIFPSYAGGQYNGTNFHVLFVNSTFSEFKNIKFCGKNTRYCVHSENANEENGCKVLFENCLFTYWKQYTYPTGYNASDLLGLGTRLNFDWVFKKCRFYHGNDSGIIGGHSGYTTDEEVIKNKKGASLIFDGCAFSGTSLIVRYDSMVSYEDSIILKNCTMPKLSRCQNRIIYNQTNPVKNVIPALVICDKPLCYDYRQEGKILRFDAVNGSEITILPSCSAYKAIISDIDREDDIIDSFNLAANGGIEYVGQIYKKGTGAHVFSTKVFSERKNSMDTLGAYLGDCSLVNKSLIISVDGVEHSHTFESNMNEVSDEDIISEINLSFNGVAIISIAYQTDLTYCHSDGVFVGTNRSEKLIRKGQGIVVYRQGFRPADDNTAFIDGVALDDTPPGALGRVATKGFINEGYVKMDSTIWKLAKVTGDKFISTSVKGEAQLRRVTEAYEIL